eukprot:5640240-Pyramimonas_sp.AAC.1
MQGLWTAMPIFCGAPLPAKAARDGPKGQGCEGKLGEWLILTVRVDRSTHRIRSGSQELHVR